MAGIFVNYRNKDQPLGAAAIHDHLARRFGQERVFRDCVSMRPGVDYPRELLTALRSADILLAIVGPEWLTVSDGEGRLIDRQTDWVRFEIATAFQRGIAVLPVLLMDTPASAPRIEKHDVPTDISHIALLQAFEFSQRRFGADLDKLTERIVELVPSLGGRPARSQSSHVPAAGSAATTTGDVHIAGNAVFGINNGGMG